MPQLTWDIGTAYDLFVSQDVLHYPTKYAVRGSWAAGMRARLPSADRDFLEQAQLLIHVPLHWIYTLPDPKDGAAALWTLRRVPAAARLPLLGLPPDMPIASIAGILTNAAETGAWEEKERDIVRAFYARLCADRRIPVPTSDELGQIISWWTRAEEFGNRYLQALRSYQATFFAEEEQRIRPALDEAVAHGQELAARLDLPDLLEELSQGLRITTAQEPIEMVLAPSYWGTPLVIMGKVAPERDIWLYGARTPTSSLVPGEVVPDTMLRALEALSDPTRLRILQYLAVQPLAPAQIARRLRLRTPTVMHHLLTLRLAGLVQLTLGQRRDQRPYATRPEAVAAIFSSLQTFLAAGNRASVSANDSAQADHDDADLVGHS